MHAYPGAGESPVLRKGIFGRGEVSAYHAPGEGAKSMLNPEGTQAT
jgi:hypothetical protein